MFTDLLVSAAVAAGQPAAEPVAPAPIGIPVARPVASAPLTLPVIRQDAAPAPMATPAAPAAPAIGANEAFITPEANKADPEAEEGPTKYALMKALEGTNVGDFLDRRGISINGWTAFSYTPSTASGSNLPVALNDRANEFLLNQNYLHIEKAIDTSKKEVQFGWTSDWILPGSDYRYTLPRGLWNRQLTSNDGRPELYGIDPFQFYGKVFLPNLGPEGTTFTVGRFATLIGYELVQQADTPFVSRSYAFQYNPFTHTGAYATTGLSENVSVSYGIVTGADVFLDSAAQTTFIGQIAITPKDSKTKLFLNTMITDPTYDVNEAFTHYNVYNMVLQHQFTDDLLYVLDAGFSHTDVPGLGTATWYGGANYLIYKLADNLSTTLRVELFEDSTGFRTGGEGLYTAVTWGFAWQPVDSFIVKPHVRYDNNSDTAVFEGDKTLWTIGLEGILRW